MVSAERGCSTSPTQLRAMLPHLLAARHLHLMTPPGLRRAPSALVPPTVAPALSRSVTFEREIQVWMVCGQFPIARPPGDGPAVFIMQAHSHAADPRNPRYRLPTVPR
jgi:hypothetical protein